jgi:hypothetical protein
MANRTTNNKNNDIYRRLRESFTAYLQAAERAVGDDLTKRRDIAQKSVLAIGDALKKADAFYDSDAAVGHVIKKSLNGQAKSISVDGVQQLNDGFEIFRTQVKEDERKDLINNLELSMTAELLRRSSNTDATETKAQ